MRRACIAVLLFASVLGTGPGARAEGCAPAAHAGGEWRAYGQDVAGTRNQPSESTISPANAGDLRAAFAVSVVGTGGTGVMHHAPVIAGGCVFVVSATDHIGPNGSVTAVNADTGEPVWRTDFNVGPGYIASAFAPAVADGRVHVLVGQPVPYAIAFDQATGDMLWRTDLPDPVHAWGINASAVVFDGLVFVPTFGGDLVFNSSRPPFYILDAASGEILKKTYVIPDEDWLDGYQTGGGMWGTAAVDAATKRLYVGTSNPYNKVKEHERTNAILQIDMDRSSETFGEILDSYKGDVDYDPALYNTFQCQTLGELQVVGYSELCGQKDVDFGASPGVFSTSSGRTLVGDLQKSGVFHAVDAATMELVWKADGLADPSANGNSSASAYDDTSVYVATNSGRVYALDRDTGAIRWVATVEGAGGYKGLTVANGVVYTVAGSRLVALDASSGGELLDVAIATDVYSCTGTNVAGVSVARNTVYAGCDTGSDGGGLVVAYRL